MDCQTNCNEKLGSYVENKMSSTTVHYCIKTYNKIACNFLFTFVYAYTVITIKYEQTIINHYTNRRPMYNSAFGTQT
jgi:FtsH-binding integral membrane protein